MIQQNVLVFPCGTEIGLEIYRSVAHSTHFNLIGGSSKDDHGRYIYDDYVSELPFVDDNDFIEKLNALIDKRKLDYIIPAHDSVLLRLAIAKDKGELNCEVIASPLKTCEIARSKAQTYEHLKNTIKTPKVYSSVEEIPGENYPVFLKPDIGQGSKGVHMARNANEIAMHLDKDPSLIILEHLPGKEYTIDCFTNMDHELMFSEGRERKRIQNGISVSSHTVNDDRFTHIAQAINATLKFRGAWFFQVKENSSGDLVLLEIAPRIAGTMGLVRCKGVNLPLLSLFDAAGLSVTIAENDYEITIDRALENRYRHNINYQHVYLDFDDLVIIDEKVNPEAMRFVYQCINKDVKVHLITKHKADLPTTLRDHHLENVFDEVIWLKEEDNKSEHINKNLAIFIDDSFAERRAVTEKCGIPVFDSHMIEALME
jgi:predicted ATP-grasp superfamily ATP-dependent carboligase